MNNKNKIFSDLSKIATDAFGTISGIRKEVDTIVKIKTEKIINKYDLVRRKEFEILKKMYEKQSKKIGIIQFEFGGCNIDSRCFFQDFFYFFSQCNMIIFRICPDKLVAVQGYNELYEHFRTTNYLAISKKLLG